jgi:hypothetical protein
MQSDKKIPIWKNQDVKSLFGERWKPIGDSLVYRVSSIGRVKTNAKGSWVIKSQWLDKDGYPKVGLPKNGYSSPSSVHRLVGMAFVPNPENKPQINHKKGIKIDNRASQLEWATNSENQKHARKYGLNKLIGETHHKAKLTNKQALEIFKSPLNCRELSIRYGIDDTTASYIKSGKLWSSVTNKKYERKKRRMLSKNKDVLFIFNSDMKGIELAKKFNITTVTVSEIKNGRTWSHITGKKYCNGR